MAVDLGRQHDVLLRRVLPTYEPLGSLAFAYMQGSLASGYTSTADLDLVVVWDQPATPAAREAIVAQLDERCLDAPVVVDYQDIHLERFVIGQQEYNVAHRTLDEMAATVRAILEGTDVPGREVLDPLTAVSGFCYGRLLSDPFGHATRLRAELAVFPARLQRETLRVLRNRRDGYRKDLPAYAARGDWPVFWSTLVPAVQTALQAIFAARAVYYPGGKWLRAAIVRFGLGAPVLSAFDRIWADGASPEERIAGLQQLLAIADPPKAARDVSAGRR